VWIPLPSEMEGHMKVTRSGRPRSDELSLPNFGKTQVSNALNRISKVVATQSLHSGKVGFDRSELLAREQTNQPPLGVWAEAFLS